MFYVAVAGDLRGWWVAVERRSVRIEEGKSVCCVCDEEAVLCAGWWPEGEMSRASGYFEVRRRPNSKEGGRCVGDRARKERVFMSEERKD